MSKNAHSDRLSAVHIAAYPATRSAAIVLLPERTPMVVRDAAPARAGMFARFRTRRRAAAAVAAA